MLIKIIFSEGGMNRIYQTCGIEKNIRYDHGKSPEYAPECVPNIISCSPKEICISDTFIHWIKHLNSFVTLLSFICHLENTSFIWV